eukprot:788388-Rhodomonas_salina.4
MSALWRRACRTIGFGTSGVDAEAPQQTPPGSSIAFLSTAHGVAALAISVPDRLVAESHSPVLGTT